MRISDWSSDVCSSDLARAERGDLPRRTLAAALALLALEEILEEFLERRAGRELRHAFRQLAALHRLGGRDVDHRRQQLFGQVGEIAFRRPRLAMPPVISTVRNIRRAATPPAIRQCPDRKSTRLNS